MRRRDRRPTGRSCAALLSLAVLLAPMDGGAAPAEPAAARDAAMGQLKRPGGVGGCMFRALPADVRREALLSALAGEGNPQALRAATPDVARKCTGQPSPSSELALVGSLVGAVRKAAAALALATQYGVGQDSLDAAWAAASPAQKAAFYEVADEFLAPDREISVRALDVAGLAAKMGLEPGAHPGAEAALRIYFLAAALSERSEAMLTKRA
jgi:hypothetical protein